MNGYKLCRCTGKGCVDLFSQDPVTGKLVSGFLLPSKTWKEHHAILTNDPKKPSTSNIIPKKDLREPSPYAESNHLPELQLKALLDNMHMRLAQLPNPASLVFVATPSREIPFVSRATVEHPVTCAAPSDLLPKAPVNAGYIDTQSYIHSTNSLVHQIIIEEDNLELQKLKQECVNILSRAHQSMEDIRRSHWQLQLTRALPNLGNSRIFDTGQYISPNWLSVGPLGITCWLLLGLLHTTFNVSRNITRLVAVMLQEIMKFTLLEVDTNVSYHDRIISSNVPLDPETALSNLKVDPKINTFVCCPKCFALYPEKYDQNGEASFPEKCTWLETPSNTNCNSRLTTFRTVLGRRHSHPIRRFVVQDMCHWLARMISRPGIEEIMDAALQSQFEPIPPVKRSIWDGEQIRNFKDKDGQPFMRYRGPEGRYIFALYYDNFNPLGNKTAGKQVSVGGIYMTCLNLPPHLIFLEENIFFVGLVPGPNKPSLTQINHLLRPIVDMVLEFWDTGIWFTSTPKYPQGRLERLAVIPLIADALASRQMGGFGAHNSEFFCIWCGLRASDIENVDPETWPARRTRDAQRQLAEQWRRAGSLEERGHLFGLHGLRYSELDRLPYRDQISHTIFDTMHGISGLIERMIREVFGLDVNKPSGDGLPMSILKTNEKPNSRDCLAALNFIQTERKGKLKRCPKPLLEFLCETYNLRRAGPKKVLANELLSYFAQEINKHTLEEHIMDLNREIHPASMENTTENTPSDSHQGRTDVRDAEQLFGLGLTPGVLEKRLLRKRRSILEILCHNRNLAIEPKDTKASLANRLIKIPTTSTDSDVIMQASIATGLSPKVSTDSRFISPEELAGVGSGNPVLGQEVMKELEKDAASMAVPSWLVKPPENWGTTQRGKLKADEWRTIGLILLPITLIRLWSSSTPRFQHMLDNYMKFVSSIRLTFSRAVTQEHCDHFRESWFSFLRGFKKLYPKSTLVSNHHNMGHVPEMMMDWGPNFYWRANNFERYNGTVQKQPTNMKFGELELTLMRKFCISAHLKFLLQDNRLPPAFNILSQKLNKFFGDKIPEIEEIHTSRNLNIWVDDGNVQYLDSGVLELLQCCLNSIYHTSSGNSTFSTINNRMSSTIILGADAILMPSVDYHGFRFRPALGNNRPFHPTDSFTPHPDSNIMIRIRSSTTPTPYSCQIYKIFKHRHFTPGSQEPVCEVFLIIKPFKPLSKEETRYDPWRVYNSAGGFLFYDEFLPMQVIRIDSITCHFVKTSFASGDSRNPIINKAIIHVMPLDWY